MPITSTIMPMTSTPINPKRCRGWGRLGVTLLPTRECRGARRSAAEGQAVGLHAVIKPLFSHSTTGEFNSPPKYPRTVAGGEDARGYSERGLTVTPPGHRRARV
eukprot:5519715-Pyramimonas_sp.AAC.1